MDHISLTIPLTHSALNRTAEMLRGLAEDLPIPGIMKAINVGSEPIGIADAVVLKPRTLSPGEMLQEGHIVDPVKYAEAIKTGVIKELTVEIPASGETATKINQDNVTQISERADLSHGAAGLEKFQNPKPQVASSAAGMVTQQPGNPTPNTTTQTATDTPAPGAMDLDSKGMPWDARIHSSGKTKLKKDSSWKLKAGVKTKHPGLIEQVEAENRANLHYRPVEIELGTVEPTPAAQVFGGGQQPVEQITPDPAATAQPVTLAQLLQMVTPRQLENPEYATVINNVLAEKKLNSLTDLAGKPDLIEPVYKRLDELWQG